MTKRSRQQLNKEELEQVKSLIGDAQAGEVTLEDILAADAAARDVVLGN